MSDTNTEQPAATALRCIAWCPDDCDADEAREYVGSTPGEIAEQHAEWMHTQGDPQESYDIHVRATKGDVVREWSVCVDVEMIVSFHASLAFPLKVSKEPAPAQKQHGEITTPRSDEDDISARAADNDTNLWGEPYDTEYTDIDL